MQLSQLLETLGKLNIYLQVQGGELKIKGAKEYLTPGLIAHIREHKPGLISVLQGSAAAKQSLIPVAETTPGSLYPLSPAQRRLWVMSQVEGSGIAYNIPGTYIFEGSLDAGSLSRAFETLIQRHESLRTVFVEDAQCDVKQQVLPAMPFTINYHDLQQEQMPEDRVRALVQSTIACRFDLASGPLLRACLVKLEESKWVFTFVMHHIISDGWSMGVLVKELLALYKNAALPPLRIQYKDYAVWQQQQPLEQHRAWWLKQFEGELPVLELPANHTRPAVKTFNGKIINRKLDAALVSKLKTLCREHDATLFMGLQAAVNVLLHRYTGQNDIITGTPIAGRDHPDLEGQIGFYVNTLALRTRIRENESFAELLNDVRATTLKAYEHQAYPFDELVNELGLQRNMSRHPLFDIMVVLQNAGAAVDVKVQEYKETESLGSKFDWLFIFTEVGEEIQANIEFNTDIYDESTLANAWLHFEQLLASIVTQPSMPVQQLDYLSAAEKQQLSLFNNAVVPNGKTIVDLFEEQVQLTPDKIALVFENTSLTYRELNERANQFAQYLGTDQELIAIKLERSEWLIIAILAVLKSGAAYMPIDPAYPQDRIDYMIADSNCKMMIDEQALEAAKAVLATYSTTKPAATAGSLAYVMYTSGSTGRPKGVMVEQRSVVRLVKADNYALLTGNETLLSTGAVSFDATTFEYWGMLLNGGKLVLCSLETLLDAQQLAAVIQKEKVTTMWFTAGWFNQLVDKDIAVFQGLQTILAGGDKLSPAHVNALLAKYPGTKIINGYGPTENTTFSLTYSITSPIKIIPVGAPISNSTAYILDSNCQLCPVGITGEICVGGEGLARGYLNQPELTAQKFITVKGERLYKTGDLGRWLPDGNILFEGRKDDQVKIRGYRIEPGEIEAVIQAHPAVESAVVIARQTPSGEKELVAYIVGEHELRSYLSKELPDYMVPAHFVKMEALPLNPNGKVDKHSLPAPADSRTTHEPPRNETEEKLVAIWREVLEKESIGIKDNFFECGGHSLKLTRLGSQLQKVFEVKISLKELFSNPVLEQQAALVQQARKTAWAAILPVAKQEHYPLSAAQRRMWIASQFGQSTYNVPSVYVLEGELNTAKLQSALNALVERHESLRTVFKQDESGEVRQYILPSLDITISQQALDTNFDLATGPLLRASLIQAAGQKWTFTLLMHHIVTDAWSMNILMNELLLFYNSGSLQPLRIQYKDYAAWQQGHVQTTHKNYWLKQFEGNLPLLTLPFARTRPAVKSYAGDNIQKRFPENVSAALKSLCLEQDSTLFMGLLAAVNALFYTYTRQEDIIIGTPIAGREHSDLEDQVGLYINTLALRTRFNGRHSFFDLLSLTREITLGGYEHQSYPFDELVNQLQLQRNAGRSILFDVMVVLQNTGSSDALPNPPWLKVSACPMENPVSAFDLTFNFIETGNEILMNIEYSTEVFTQASVLRLADDLQQLLQTVTQDPANPLEQLIASPKQTKKKQLIDDLEL